MSSPVSKSDVGIRERFKSLKSIVPLCGLLWLASPKLLLGTVAVRLLRAMLPSLLLWIPKKIIDEVISSVHHPASLKHIWMLLGLECALSLLDDFLQQANTVLDALLGERLTSTVAIKLITHVSSLDLSAFEDPTFYDKLERVRGQATGRVFVVTSVLSAAQEVMTLLTLSAGLIIYSPWLLVLVICSTVPTFIGESRFSQLSYSAFFRRTPQRRQLEYIRLLGSWADSAKEVRVYGLGGYLSTWYRRLANDLYEESAALIVKRAFGGTALGLIALLGYYSGYLVILNATLAGRTSIGTFTFLTGSLARSRMSTERIFSSLNGLTEQALLLSDLFEVLSLTPSIKAPLNAAPVPEMASCGFAFQDVCFAYSGKGNILNNLTFTIRPSEKVALIGGNGAGKSTIVKLLTRLYDPSSGEVMLDGVDFRQYDLIGLRSSIGVLFQDYMRYDLTVRENVGFGSLLRLNNDVFLDQASERADARALIDQLPLGWNQVLGKRYKTGTDLSGGEWQKIALSRALLNESLLLILDEPTASLDAEAEEHIMREVLLRRTGPAVLLISHKLSLARLADRILFLEAGRIVEEGSHDELIQRNGRYAEMFNLQASGFLAASFLREENHAR